MIHPDLEQPMDGTCKWFSDDKGYGFLTDGQQDYFVHHSAIRMDGRRKLETGEKVTFDVEQGPKGMKAVNVVRAG